MTTEGEFLTSRSSSDYNTSPTKSIEYTPFQTTFKYEDQLDQLNNLTPNYHGQDTTGHPSSQLPRIQDNPIASDSFRKVMSLKANGIEVSMNMMMVISQSQPVVYRPWQLMRLVSFFRSEVRRVNAEKKMA